MSTRPESRPRESVEAAMTRPPAPKPAVPPSSRATRPRGRAIKVPEPTPALCRACGRVFADLPLFDAHRTLAGDQGTCRDPASITKAKTGERVMFHRNGMWRGPEDPEAAQRWAR